MEGSRNWRELGQGAMIKVCQDWKPKALLQYETFAHEKWHEKQNLVCGGWGIRQSGWKAWVTGLERLPLVSAFMAYETGRTRLFHF